MSTNHPERLDPALVRPGRVDVRMEVPNADRGQARRLFVRSFGPGASVGRPAGEFAVAIGDGRRSMATIRGPLLESSDDPEMAVRVARRCADIRPRVGGRDRWGPLTVKAAVCRTADRVEAGAAATSPTIMVYADHVGRSAGSAHRARATPTGKPHQVAWRSNGAERVNGPPAMMTAVKAYLGVVALTSCACFIAYRLDKRRAADGGRRVPERTLHLLAFLGGWPGALLAQRQFRHKTRKGSFRVVFWAVVVLHAGIVGTVAYALAGWPGANPVGHPTPINRG